jgi:ectoine hydroxylase-related dioxygenase (phytanoyl-CoA dioxygenase family)
MLNMLVMVDAFTAENGATRVLPGSHLRPERPDDETLARQSVQAVGPAGSILLFDSNLWHAAAPNHTARARVALTPTFTRAFVKPQLDYPRLLGEDYPATPRLRQLLGYRARVPSTLSEWYQPPEKRFYHRDQG